MDKTAASLIDSQRQKPIKYLGQVVDNEQLISLTTVTTNIHLRRFTLSVFDDLKGGELDFNP
jgi:hypothetical protein